MLNRIDSHKANLVRFKADRSWVIEERVALVPVIGSFVAKSLPRSDVKELKAEYGPHPNQYSLLFWPDTYPIKKRTALYFLHGGGWNSGNPSLFRFVGNFFASLGYPTILGGYRLAPEYHFPTQLEDVSYGLKIGLESLRDLGIPVENLIIGGQSAGAHLASLMVYARDIHPEILKYENRIGGFFSISGPLDFNVCTIPALLKMIAELTGDGSDSSVANPVDHISGGETVPALLIHGDRDPLVDLENSISFASKLAEHHGSQVQVHLVRGGHHADLASIFLRDLPTTRVLTRWLNQKDRDI